VKTWQLAVGLAVACLVAAAAGYWTGFRAAWSLAVAVDLAPRGARSVAHLEAIEQGKLRPVRVALEFDVDNGLIWGYEVVNHPLRGVWAPLLGLELYEHYERDLVRLANYRRDHPSGMRAEMFQKGATESEFGRTAREASARRDAMVQRFATPLR
jgi:hypothetical protein